MAGEIPLRDSATGRFHLGHLVDGNEIALLCDAPILASRLTFMTALPIDVEHKYLCRSCFQLKSPVASRGR